MIVGKDIFDKSTTWHMPAGEKKESLEFYSQIEANFHKKLNEGKLNPIVYNLESAYENAVYSGGMHTSRAPTAYSKSKKGMYDHVFYNDNRLKVLKILEIP